jgi:hypothetical protein
MFIFIDLFKLYKVIATFMIKINRKPNGEVLGLPIFLGVDVVNRFVIPGATHLEVKKTHTANGILLEFESVKAEINEEH